MDINIRRSVLQNMNKSTYDDIKATVDDAISQGEEKMLPGLGVLFEVLYNSSDANGKREIISKLEKSLQ